MVALHGLAPDFRSPHINMYVDPFLPLTSTPRVFGFVPGQSCGEGGRAPRANIMNGGSSRVNVKPGVHLPSHTLPVLLVNARVPRYSSFKLHQDLRTMGVTCRSSAGSRQDPTNLALGGGSASNVLLTAATAASTRNNWVVLLS